MQHLLIVHKHFPKTTNLVATAFKNYISEWLYQMLSLWIWLNLPVQKDQAEQNRVSPLSSTAGL